MIFLRVLRLVQVKPCSESYTHFGREEGSSRLCSTSPPISTPSPHLIFLSFNSHTLFPSPSVSNARDENHLSKCKPSNSWEHVGQSDSHEERNSTKRTVHIRRKHTKFMWFAGFISNSIRLVFSAFDSKSFDLDSRRRCQRWEMSRLEPKVL